MGFEWRVGEVNLNMACHPLAGRRTRPPPDPPPLTDIPALLAAYFDAPDVNQPAQRVAFGTSGHRGSA
jgi:phosphoglucomutase